MVAHHSRLIPLFLVLLTACGTPRGRRPDAAREEHLVQVPRTTQFVPIAFGKEAFARALATEVRRKRPPANPETSARELLDVAQRDGWYHYTPRQGLIALNGHPSSGEWAAAEERITREYSRFCASLGQPGDCRKVLLNSPVLTADGRYALAMSFALEEVIPEMREAFEGMADPEAIRASILWTMTLYAAMWMAPEPVFSKGLAAVVTASFICYVGVDTFWTLIQGWRRLVQAADLATSMRELRTAGGAYGKVMGKNAARAFALLLAAAMGQTASSYSARVAALPGAARVSGTAGSGLGIALPQVAHVEGVVVNANVATFTLAMPMAATLAEGSGSGAVSAPVEAEGPEHHIATNKWWDATHSGGPWTPRFQDIFDRAGMSLNDPANKIRIPGHQGPHPQAYHEEVFERLNAATLECRGTRQCQEALVAELRALAVELHSEGSRLHTLVTRSTR